MLQYCSDSLLAAAKRRARLPDAAFSVDELLAVASEELETYIQPLIVSAAEEYYETFVDFPLLPDAGRATVPVTKYRVPSRASANALREVMFLDTAGSPVDVPRLAIVDLERASWGFLLQGQEVTYLDRTGRGDVVTLRMTFALAPNALCRMSSAASIVSVNGTTLTLETTEGPPWPLDGAAEGSAPGSFTGHRLFDVIRSSPGFELVGYDLPAVAAGSTMQLTSLPAGLAVGDYVALAGTSPVPQVPAVLWGLLAQAIAVELLSQLGHDDQAQRELAKRDLMENQCAPLIRNRVRGAPKSIFPRTSVFSATRRW